MRNYLADFYWIIRSKTFEALCFLAAFYEYSNKRFAKADKELRALAKQSSPYHTYKKDLQSKNRSLLDIPYGETPLVTIRRIVNAFGLSPEHKVLELGCGRGRVAFWLATQVGCQTIAIDQVDEFIEKARFIAKSCGIRETELQFIHGDILEAPFEEVDFVYLYGTGFGDSFYERLILKLHQLEKVPPIITIAGPLSEYSDSFLVAHQINVAFPWGWTGAYLNYFKRF